MRKKEKQRRKGSIRRLVSASWMGEGLIKEGWIN